MELEKISIKNPPDNRYQANYLLVMANDQTIDTMHLFYIGCTRVQVPFFDAFCLWHTDIKDKRDKTTPYWRITVQWQLSDSKNILI